MHTYNLESTIDCAYYFDISNFSVSPMTFVVSAMPKSRYALCRPTAETINEA